ncbi:stearoyl-CoA desaturase (delta-9 desaturase) [Micromonospora inyonensis]|uniref:Stearoyl-CoA desaturase (Delta-9 desaturase) n=1 Tax=Micromonospora inyonensis TaxID=47866 RepID=A0A1C6S6F8_9ACTN|nr:stearoyl-CoA desaturase (delta-9 desaturase) [Micromonospora inyonensis]
MMRRWAYLHVLLSTAGFAGAIVLEVLSGFHWWHLAVFTGMYLVTSIGVEGGLHRFFTHRSFRAGPVLTAALGIAGSMAAQGTILFWVSVHRKHHAFADRDGDPHSPRPRGPGLAGALAGFWHGHMGWLFTVDQTGWDRRVTDLLHDRRVMTIDRYYAWWVGAGLVLPALGAFAVTGRPVDALAGLLWGGFARMFVLDHVTWTVNSLGHLIGNRPHPTRDGSGNIAGLAPITVGGSWHNNHHAQPSIAHNRQSFWQLDLTGSVIRVFEKLGLAHDVRYRAGKGEGGRA